MEASEVRQLIGAGAAWGEVTRQLLDEGVGPIHTLKVLREAGLPLDEGKRLVDAALPVEQQLSNAAVRAIAAETLEESDG